MFEFTFTQQQVVAILDNNKQASDWFYAFNEVLPNFEITSILRVAAFLAQTGHESGNYTIMHENLNYRGESLIRTWPNRFNASNAAQYARQPEKIANKVYSNRMGNGDEASGDGWKFRGRGPIQITGKENYATCSQFLFQDLRLLDTPELIEDDMNTAVMSACWYWDKNNLNALADAENMKAITKRINGGFNGLDDRMAKYAKAIAVLNDPALQNIEEF